MDSLHSEAGLIADLNKRIAALEAELAALREQEPVAFQFGQRWQYVANYWPPENVDCTARPLYTAPQPAIQSDWADRQAKAKALADSNTLLTGSRSTVPVVEPAIPEGFVLVPVEPTPEMLGAGRDSLIRGKFQKVKNNYERIYKSMLAAQQEGK